jgi:hypothetical protein
MTVINFQALINFLFQAHGAEPLNWIELIQLHSFSPETLLP